MKNLERSKAVKIGTTFVITYIASYYMRNLLGVLTPSMLQTSGFTKEFIGALSSAYMIVYAIGQLVNGGLGDRINPKFMISLGLVLTGSASILFPFITYPVLQVICFAAIGYGLSMLRGPMMKAISANTLPKYARIICAFFSSASFIGAFIAGLLAMLYEWKSAFIVAGLVILVIAVAAFLIVSFLERKKLVVFEAQKKSRNILGLFKVDKFIFYMLIGMLVEISATSISFWIPTYLTEYLGIDNNTANMIFVVKSVLRVATPFIAITLFGIIKDDIKIVKYSFLASGILFILMLFTKNVFINVSLFFVSLLVSGFASAMLWSVYIPSLNSTGKVSSANGVLDCAGYVGAAAANLIFANVVDMINWNGVIVIWAILMLSGSVLALVKEHKK